MRSRFRRVMIFCMTLRNLARIATLSLLATTLACSINQASNEPQMPVGLEPLSQRSAKAPAVGDLFPDVTVVDDEGRPVNIRSLAGEKPYTVLTLGCLT